MLQGYYDITRALTRFTRQAHYYHYLWRVEGAEVHDVGTHPQCTTFNAALVGKPDEFSPDGKRCCTCVAKPLWWDETAPRASSPIIPICAPISTPLRWRCC